MSNSPLEEATKEAAWLPTMNGKTNAYEAEYRSGAYIKGNLAWSDWERIPTENVSGGRGVPYPLATGGVFQTIGLHGYEQAHAFAWTFAAEAVGQGSIVETRVCVYELTYDIKARKREGGERPCRTHP